MAQPITVEILDRMRPNLASLVMERAKRLSGLRYCDLRIQVREETKGEARSGRRRGAGHGGGGSRG